MEYYGRVANLIIEVSTGVIGVVYSLIFIKDVLFDVQQLRNLKIARGNEYDAVRTAYCFSRLRTTWARLKLLGEVSRTAIDEDAQNWTRAIRIMLDAKNHRKRPSSVARVVRWIIVGNRDQARDFWNRSDGSMDKLYMLLERSTYRDRL